MIADWLSALAYISLATGIASALWLLADVRRNPPQMALMRFVWPLCGLFGGPLLIAFYRKFGRSAGDQPFPATVAKGALHCGAGCALADLIAESIAHWFPAILVAFGLGSIFSEKIFATWIFDYIMAFAIGIAFQYYAIAPMRDLGLREGLVQAVKADTLSLTSWQIGMYGLMAVFHFWLFAGLFRTELKPGMPEFWFAMQLAMLAGLATAYLPNWFLITSGVKEEM